MSSYDLLDSRLPLFNYLGQLTIFGFFLHKYSKVRLSDVSYDWGCRISLEIILSLDVDLVNSKELIIFSMEGNEDS